MADWAGLDAAAAARSDLATRRAEITAAITDLKRRQQNLINELERLQPSGDADADEAWRRGIQNRFTATVAEQRQKQQLLTDLAREGQAAAPADVDILDLLPQRDIDVRSLPEDQQRDIYDVTSHAGPRVFTSCSHGERAVAHAAAGETSARERDHSTRIARVRIPNGSRDAIESAVEQYGSRQLVIEDSMLSP